MTITASFLALANAPAVVVCKSGTTYTKNANGMITGVSPEDVNDLEQAGYVSAGEDQVTNNFAGTTAPAVTDDITGGYGVGSLWCDTTGHAVYVCVDATVGAAVWVPMTGAAISVAHTWSAIQTITNSMLKLLGSSTGATTFTSANAGATNYTLTLPAATDTVSLGKCATCTAQVDRATSTVLTDVTGCSLALVDGGKYALEAVIFGVATVNGGAKAAFASDGTLTATAFRERAEHYNGATLNAASQDTTLGNAVGAATAVMTAIKLQGYIEVNVAGSIKLQIAQNASHSDTTSAYVGSFIKATRVA